MMIIRSLATGCRVEITSNDFYAFKDLQSCFQREAFDAPIFYPGNLIMGKLPSVKNIKILTPNLPLYTSKKNKNSRKVNTPCNSNSILYFNLDDITNNYLSYNLIFLCSSLLWKRFILIVCGFIGNVRH